VEAGDTTVEDADAVVNLAADVAEIGNTKLMHTNNVCTRCDN